jgi:hypothetical protein
MTARTAVVYRRTRLAILIPLLSLHPLASVPCGTDRALLHSPPGSKRGKVRARRQYRLPPVDIICSATARHNNGIAPLPGFGIDRMGDFSGLRTVSLWKSGPLFSTGTTEAELMVRELRLNLRSPASRFARRRPSGEAGNVEGGVGPRLSTAFAEQIGRPSPGSSVLIRSPKSASRQGGKR